jgi:hypothetical protein
MSSSRRRLHDHFHLRYAMPAGVEHTPRGDAELSSYKGEPRWEIEGGFTDLPADWDSRSDEQRQQYWQALGVAWGMPPEGIVKDVRLAG